MSSLIVPVVKIKNLKKHPNADRLDIAQLDGLMWECIVGKGDHEIGDEVIYIPPDSILPEKIITDFKIDYLKKGERVRSVKLRKVISHGLILPNFINAKVGENVAEKLGITKHIPGTPPVKIRGRIRKKFNSNFHKYSDIENLRNYPNVFKEGEPVIIMEKIHGMNFRAGWVQREERGIFKWLKRIFNIDTYEFIIGSHNVQYKEGTDNVFTVMAKKYDLKNKIPKGLVFYGEIYGKKIQDLEYGLKEIRIVFFDIKKGDRYLDCLKARDILYDTGLPSLETLSTVFHIDFIKKLSEDKSGMPEANHIKEGVIIRPLKEEWNNRIGRKILKYKSDAYLARKGGTEFK